MIFPQLQLIQSQAHGLRSPETAPEQQSNQRHIPPAAKGGGRDFIFNLPLQLGKGAEKERNQRFRDYVESQSPFWAKG